MTPSEANVTTSDVRDAGFCVEGLKEWCEANRVDLRKLVRGRYSIQEMIDIGAWDDAYGRKVLERAMNRQGVEL